MKRILHFVILAISIFAQSCKEDAKELPLFDFGPETFDEPFVGPLSSRPEILVKSLEYPPFSWLMSDTVTFTKELEIEFNEDCIRSESKAYIQFVDTLYRPLKDIAIFINEKDVNNIPFCITADSSLIDVQISISVPPSIGDCTFAGYVVLSGINIDNANGVDLQNSSTPIGEWNFQHKIGWPITIWGLWLLIVVLTLLIILFAIYVVARLVYVIPTSISMINMVHQGGVTCKMSFMEIMEVKFKKGWSNEALKWIENVDIAKIYMELPLKESVINGHRSLILKDLDGKLIDKGTLDNHTNKVTMSCGNQPLYYYKGELNSIELHHSGQDPNSLLVELPFSVHKDHFKTLHTRWKDSKIDREEFRKIKKQYWIARSKMF